MEIIYLCHSGFAVDTGAHFLVFDYYLDTPRGGGLEQGVIDAHALRGRDVVVFASHSHGDHYNPAVLDWEGANSLRYVFSDDIRAKDGRVTPIRAGQTLTVGDLTVRALESTDQGVAFLVRVDGKCIYHAGDLNWWHWEGEPERDNERMAQRYKAEIGKLRGEAIDVAFIPADLRQEQNCVLGLDYFMRTVGAGLVVPMHFWEKYRVFDVLLADTRTADYAGKIIRLVNRGQRIVV